MEHTVNVDVVLIEDKGALQTPGRQGRSTGPVFKRRQDKDVGGAVGKGIRNAG
jgi:hypothetical protein